MYVYYFGPFLCMISKGYNRDGYDKEGYDYGGFDRYGFNELGFDRYGYNISGQDIYGNEDETRRFNYDGYDSDCFNREG